MSTRTIVAATDFSDRSLVAVAAARQLAEMVGAKRLHLVHVLDTGLGGSPLPYTIPEAQAEEARAEAFARAEDRLRSLELLPGIERTVEVRLGEPAYELAVAADEVDAECVVVATQGRGAIRRAILGSVTSALLGYAQCPVLVVGKDRSTINQLQNILVSVDLSPVSGAVLRAAAGLTRQSGGRLKVMSVYQRPFSMPGEHPIYFTAATEAMEIEAAETQHKALNDLIRETIPGIEVESDVATALEPADRILMICEETPPDVLVIGSSGIRTWGRRIFGTNAERIIAKTNVPVLVIPDPHRRGVEIEPQLLKRGRPAEKRHPDEQMVFALFDDELSVRRAIAALVDANVSAEDISVLMSEDTHRDKFNTEHPDEAFTAGGALGASVGGIMGGLASMGAASGIGLMVVGPAVALGLAGGLLGSLLGFGVPTSEAEELEAKVKEGQTLVAVHTHDFESLQTAKDAFAAQGVMPKRFAL
jgi:nucleotide-binding universal stress UspA family protein